jgi:WXXGXW repeat (2 copies)
MKSPSILRSIAVCGGAALLLSACVVAPYPAGPAYPQAGAGDVIVSSAPPAPYAEIVPVMPYPGAIWISGYWGWNQGRHHWVPGRYARPVPGHRWEPHRWTPGPRGNWHLRGGAWVR